MREGDLNKQKPYTEMATRDPKLLVADREYKWIDLDFGIRVPPLPDPNVIGQTGHIKGPIEARPGRYKMLFQIPLEVQNLRLVLSRDRINQVIPQLGLEGVPIEIIEYFLPKLMERRIDTLGVAPPPGIDLYAVLGVTGGWKLYIDAMDDGGNGALVLFNEMGNPMGRMNTSLDWLTFWQGTNGRIALPASNGGIVNSKPRFIAGGGPGPVTTTISAEKTALTVEKEVYLPESFWVGIGHSPIPRPASPTTPVIEYPASEKEYYIRFIGPLDAPYSAR